jgi:putative peptidoglycan lipid II flippase
MSSAAKQVTRVLSVGLIATALTLVGKVLAFGRDVALSRFFGASGATDAFFIANAIPGILWATIHVTIGIVFLPVYVTRLAEGSGSAQRFAQQSVQIYFLLALFMTLVCVVGAGPIVQATSSQSSPETLELARNLTAIMAVGFCFSGYVAVQNAIQQAHGRFGPPLVVPVINNAMAVLGVFIAYVYSDIRIAVVFAVLGWIVQSPIQRLQTRQFYPSIWRVNISSEDVRRLALLSLPVMLGTFLDQINIYIGIYLAGGMGPGAISHLNYASRLAMFLATTFSMLVSYFLFPRLAVDAVAADDARTGRTLALGILLIVGATLPPTVVSVMMREDVVSLVYGRGALSADDIAATASAYALFALGIVFIAVREIFNRLFFSHQRMVVPLVIGAVASVVNFFVSRWLGEIMGPAGIALGASAAGAVYLLGQAAVTFIWKPRLFTRALAIELVALFGAAVAGWLALQAMLPLLEDWALVLRLLGGGVIFTAVFLLALTPLVWRGGFRRLL